MKKLLFNWLFSPMDRIVIINALWHRAETDSYQNNPAQNADLKERSEKLAKYLITL